MKPRTPKKKRRQTRKIDKKAAFLASFQETCNITDSAAAVGMDRSLHYQWLRDDPAYKARFDDAFVIAGGGLKDRALNWAFIGIEEPLVYQGQFCYAERERVLALLPDGREVFVEDLPKAVADLKIQGFRTIKEKYGPPLTVRRRSEAIALRMLAAWLPNEFGSQAALKLSGSLEVTSPDEAKRELERKLAGVIAVKPDSDGDSEPE